MLIRIKNPVSPQFRSILCQLSALFLAFSTLTLNAVELSTDGIGDVLFMPYYTVRAVEDRDKLPARQYQTFFQLTNTKPHTVVFSLNIKEAQAGRLCRNLRVVLSPEDVCNGQVKDGQ